MESVVSATQARINLGKLIRQVLAGEVVVIEHIGKPAVVVLSVEEYTKLKAKRQQGWRETLEKILQLNARMQAANRRYTAFDAASRNYTGNPGGTRCPAQ